MVLAFNTEEYRAFAKFLSSVSPCTCLHCHICQPSTSRAPTLACHCLHLAKSKTHISIWAQGRCQRLVRPNSDLAELPPKFSIPLAMVAPNMPPETQLGTQGRLCPKFHSILALIMWVFFLSASSFGCGVSFRYGLSNKRRCSPFQATGHRSHPNCHSFLELPFSSERKTEMETSQLPPPGSVLGAGQLNWLSPWSKEACAVRACSAQPIRRLRCRRCLRKLGDTEHAVRSVLLGPHWLLALVLRTHRWRESTAWPPHQCCVHRASAGSSVSPSMPAEGHHSCAS